MTDEILRTAAACTYDFRKTAEPDDPLRFRFQEWLDYYRLKWSIARVLNPQRILEVGVGNGYSALAFLDACPNAEYVGLEVSETATSNYEISGLHSRTTLQEKRARFIKGESLDLSRLPRQSYDLIHLNEQRDEARTHRNLTVALEQARYVLVNGFFSVRDNFLNVSEFLFAFRDLIRSYAVIPGYSGELIIETNARSGDAFALQEAESPQISHLYETRYYLSDCGGFEDFNQSGGVRLDSRLEAMAQIGRVAPPGKVLDIGCGRGELAMFFAREGRQVTAVDYSSQAIALARNAADAAGLSASIDFRCSDATLLSLSEEYSLVLAGGVVEHLAPRELERLYGLVASRLVPRGLFVVHTYPNLWYYQYEYARRRRVARAVGAHLPIQPRSRFEQVMHINEQSPRVLRQELGSHFEHVLLWFSEHNCERPGENLERRFKRSEMRAAGDLFAVASASPVPTDAIRRALTMHPVPVELSTGFELRVKRCPDRCRSRAEFDVLVEISNGTSVSWNSRLPNPLRLAYHWLTAEGRLFFYEGDRSPLGPGLLPATSSDVAMRVRAPLSAGSYILRITLLQEYVRWFDTPPLSLWADNPMSIE